MTSITMTGENINGFFEIEIADGPFSGVKYYYTRVGFGGTETSDGKVPLQFSYTTTHIPEGVTLNEDFDVVLGDALLAILDEQIKTNSVVYKGGV